MTIKRNFINREYYFSAARYDRYKNVLFLLLNKIKFHWNQQRENSLSSLAKNNFVSVEGYLNKELLLSGINSESRERGSK